MICDATGAGPLQSVELTWSRAAMKRKVRHYTRKEKEKEKEKCGSPEQALYKDITFVRTDSLDLRVSSRRYECLPAAFTVSHSSDHDCKHRLQDSAFQRIAQPNTALHDCTSIQTVYDPGLVPGSADSASLRTCI